jgi:hypothetical protein
MTAGVKCNWIEDYNKKLYRCTMELEQMMAHLLAEMETNQDRHQSKGNESWSRASEGRNTGQDGKQPRKDGCQVRCPS